MSDLPSSGVEGFDPERFLGTWHIVASNYGYWNSRVDPTVTYEAMPAVDGRRAWRDTLRFRKRGMLGGELKAGTLGGVDVELEPARFLWRGDGLLRVIKSPWWVLMVDEAYEWAVTYFGRSNVGTAPGMDIYGRRADLAPSLVAEVVSRVRAHEFLGPRSRGLFATVQGALPTNRYALD